MTEETPELVLEPEKPKMREIIIETDGKMVNVKKADCTSLEARAIFQMLLKQLGG